LQPVLGILGLVALAWLASEERRGEVVSLGLKSIVAGTLATCLISATVALVV